MNIAEFLLPGMKEEQNVNLKIIPPEKYLPMVAVAVAAFLIMFLTAATYNQLKEGRYVGKDAQYKNTISVSGEGKVVAKPDIGQISLSVISDAATVAAAQKDNTDKMNKITKAMKDLGIKEEDLKTTSYNVSPRYQYTRGISEIIGYEVIQMLEVKIRDLSKVGDILGKATSMGANQIGALNFTFDNPETQQNQARQKAIEQAKQKAKDLASNLGVRLGKVVSFSENFVGQPIPIYASDALGKGGGGGVAPDIQTGQNEVQVSVNIIYEIK